MTEQGQDYCYQGTVSAAREQISFLMDYPVNLLVERKDSSNLRQDTYCLDQIREEKAVIRPLLQHAFPLSEREIEKKLKTD